MAITTYTELKAAVATWLNRTDLTAIIPDFITIAERDIARNLRASLLTSTITVTGETYTLAADVGEVRSIRMNASPYYHVLDRVTYETLADYKTGTSGISSRYAVVGGLVYFSPVPSAPTDFTMAYYEKLVPLATSATNTTLTASPDIYLFATLKEAELYLEHDERNIVWSQKYQKALMEENVAREQREVGGAPVTMRLPVVFE